MRDRWLARTKDNTRRTTKPSPSTQLVVSEAHSSGYTLRSVISNLRVQVLNSSRHGDEAFEDGEEIEDDLASGENESASNQSSGKRNGSMSYLANI